MESRTLGDSELQVTRLGLGLAALGRPGYINLGHREDLAGDYAVATMEMRAHAVLDAAWDAGVRYFDAARSYGRAEAFLGAWLRAREHQDVTVGSKWGYTYTAGWRVDAAAHEVKEHSLSLLDRQIEESRNCLGDHLKLYQIHSATLESGVLENVEVLKRLAKLKAAGLRVGLSVSGTQQPEVIRSATALQVDGQRLFDTCQATWNVLERSATEALAEAHAAGLGIIIKEGLANGRLTDRNLSEEFRHTRERLTSLADSHDTTMDAIALAVILAQPWVDVVLSGAANPEHLRSNASATKVALSADLFEDLTESPATYWAVRAALPWG